MRENRVIVGAFAVSVVLHLLLAVVTWRIPFVPRIDPAQAAERADEIEVLLVDDPADAAAKEPDQPDQPTAITSIPDRLASATPPPRADFLAEHNAVAADRSGGSGDRPRADEEGPFPQVDILQEQLDGAGGVAFSQAPLPEPREAVGSPAAGDEGKDERKSESESGDDRGDWALPAAQSEAGGKTKGDRDDQQDAPTKQPDLEDWWGGQAPSVLKEGDQATVGDRGFEFDQKSMGDLGAGVAVDGEFSLNTYQWDYAPWIKHFANQLHRHWVAPYAYRLGVISGMTRMRMVVEKDGRLSSLEVLETDGHASLHDASQAALKAFAPYAPLPATFPEDNLVIILSLHYPAWRR